jgi:hypothetical protein
MHRTRGLDFHAYSECLPGKLEQRVLRARGPTSMATGRRSTLV